MKSSRRSSSRRPSATCSNRCSNTGRPFGLRWSAALPEPSPSQCTATRPERDMLELDDIQHFLLTRPRAMAARYGFLTFHEAAQSRAYLAVLLDKVGTGESVAHSPDLDARWVTVALTWNGLRALGVDESSLATFPEEFRQGMAARAEILGDTGANHPDNWTGGLASPDLHAVIILFARNVAERERCVRVHQEYVAQFPSVQALSFLDL